MRNLRTAAKYVTKHDRRLIRFAGCPVKKKHIRLFCRNLYCTDECSTALRQFSAPDILRYTVLLALAAIKSEDFSTAVIRGFRIAVRTETSDGETLYEIRTDGRTIIQVKKPACRNPFFLVQYINPIVLADEYALSGYMDTLLAVCSRAELRWIRKNCRITTE